MNISIVWLCAMDLWVSYLHHDSFSVLPHITNLRHKEFLLNYFCIEKFYSHFWLIQFWFQSDKEQMLYTISAWIYNQSSFIPSRVKYILASLYYRLTILNHFHTNDAIPSAHKSTCKLHLSDDQWHKHPQCW